MILLRNNYRIKTVLRKSAEELNAILRSNDLVAIDRAAEPILTCRSDRFIGTLPDPMIESLDYSPRLKVSSALS